MSGMNKLFSSRYLLAMVNLYWCKSGLILMQWLTYISVIVDLHCCNSGLNWYNVMCLAFIG